MPVSDVSTAGGQGRNAAPGRQTNLDGLRGLAALIVVVSHGIIAFDFALYTGRQANSVASWDVALSGAPLLLPLAGNLSVCVFFALSGYVLSASLARTTQGALPLLVKRYVRFALPMLSACLLAWALLAAGWVRNQELAVLTRSTWLAGQMQQPPSLPAALAEGSYGALLNAPRFDLSYDSSLWTMPIELAGSAMLILVFTATRFGAARARFRAPARILVFTLLALIACTSYLGLFAMGVLLQLTGVDRHLSSRTAVVLLAFGLFLGTIPYSAVPWGLVAPMVQWHYPVIAQVPHPYAEVALWHAPGAILVLMAANALPPLRRLLEARAVQFLGEISFPLYLVHVPLLLSAGSGIGLGLLQAGAAYPWAAAITVVVYVAVSLGVATALLYVVERPAIALSRQAGVTLDRGYQWVGVRIRGYLALPGTGTVHALQKLHPSRR